jgi:hypothetical protein
MSDLTLACQCGAFRAVIRDVSNRTGNHAVCYCVDCRAFVRHLGQEDRILDAQGGSQLYQAQPYQVAFLSGTDHLAVMKLSEKGLYRWYATCCDTPLGLTAGTPKISFASFLVANMHPPLDTLGPVRFRYKADQALSTVTEAKGSLIGFAARTTRNAMRSRLNGKWRKTPFFDAQSGQSIVLPRVLSPEERALAYDEG